MNDFEVKHVCFYAKRREDCILTVGVANPLGRRTRPSSTPAQRTACSTRPRLRQARSATPTPHRPRPLRSAHVLAHRALLYNSTFSPTISTNPPSDSRRGRSPRQGLQTATSRPHPRRPSYPTPTHDQVDQRPRARPQLFLTPRKGLGG